jgi:hypothetical protein
MSKEALAYVKGILSALLVVTLAAILIVPLTSEIANSRQTGSEISIYLALVLVWILLAVTLSIIYLALEGSKGIKPIPLPTGREEE